MAGFNMGQDGAYVKGWDTYLMGNYLNYFTHTVYKALDKGYFMGYTY